jgi:hypothetical protein
MRDRYGERDIEKEIRGKRDGDRDTEKEICKRGKRERKREKIEQQRLIGM